MEALQSDNQLQPDPYASFRCLGADCPDTCCEGWGVAVDKGAYDKYQQCSDPVFQPLFQRLITINLLPTASNYASIQLNDGRCPFLAEKLCSIHKELGEDYLSHTCATFPRNIRHVSGSVEKSLDVSCPEAARLVLTDSRPIRFYPSDDEQPPSYRQEARTLIIEILQNRRYPLASRLMLVAQLCDLLKDETYEVLHQFRDDIESGGHDMAFQLQPMPKAAQLALALELINARMRLDFVSERYLELYREFAAGLQMRAGSDLSEITRRYVDAAQDFYTPFMDRHEHMLENYLVTYIYKTVFPFGRSNGNLSPDSDPIPAQRYMLLASYYSIIQTVMIGLSAKYQAGFGIEHVLRCVQSSTRALEHCVSYPAKVLEILAAKGIRTAEQMALATAN